MTTTLNQQEINKREHDATISAKRVALNHSLVREEYDYIGMTYPTATTEVIVYKSGGSGGTTVATVTITYVDSTKAQVSSVART